ncbi:MAG: dTDP-4-dehydrorhamnose 3,5-epimerase [Trichlorobacter sp.]|uniref:dTDP-4-dehydrorhamnose 3,5-epimerase n=1 Tax=Trichlorobacter sp. TaxID=2911007 RepID=UPI00256D05B2|nr:dTDP-4-dehydrorhamnose 3,5-epimerase [Trichlorobacter sp.]MDK9719218.1 dTDP-4-dehydrorhamnose 3,5-epimerase [Trichlorobacter sp.]
MKIISTPLMGVSLIEPNPFCDDRGIFYRAFCNRELAPVLGTRQIVQTNFSRTHAVGAVRGMHYQNPPHAEMKLIRCLKGKIWDVAVDVRAGSPTFLQWFGVELSPDNALMMVIPEGCAHGFQVLNKNSELLYLHTSHYKPEAECGVRFNDPLLAISWPLQVTDTSKRDMNHPLITPNFGGIAT